MRHATSIGWRHVHKDQLCKPQPQSPLLLTHKKSTNFVSPIKDNEIVGLDLTEQHQFLILDAPHPPNIYYLFNFIIEERPENFNFAVKIFKCWHLLNRRLRKTCWKVWVSLKLFDPSSPVGCLSVFFPLYDGEGDGVSGGVLVLSFWCCLDLAVIFHGMAMVNKELFVERRKKIGEFCVF